MSVSLAITYTRRRGRYPHSFRIDDEGFWRPEVVNLRNSIHAWARDNEMEFETAMNGLETNFRRVADAAMCKLR